MPKVAKHVSITEKKWISTTIVMRYAGVTTTMRVIAVLSGIMGVVCSVSGDSPQDVAEIYRSLAPQYMFASTFKEQEAQLKDNPLIRRFEASRSHFRAKTAN